MASSRLEKIGTILSRIDGLLKSGAMKWEERPLWYDIYKTFPPKDEPKFDRPAPDIPVRAIFYQEDNIRAQYQKNTKNLGTINMFNNESFTKTKKFIEIYNKLEASDQIVKEQLYDNAVQMLNKELEKQTEGSLVKEPGLAESFKQAQEKLSQKLDVTNIFKE